jgi:septal ring-binding cell division protein DamX
VRSWQRLSPLLQEICATVPVKNSLSVMAFVTAGDMLQALDRFGPALGLEISADGLRRLARLLSDKPGMDPLRYVDEIDPELRHLYGFDTLGGESSDSEPLSFNCRFIRTAFAGTTSLQSLARLNKWVPSKHELDQYLSLMRKFLRHNADSILKGVNISSQTASVYKNLVLAAAWQESCWRQYIVEGRKLAPLRSDSGDVGLMQINERVWRGFYSRHKLKWDINYNVRAGCEILMKYLVDYALTKDEHKRGNVHYLARAVYSAYNGGPSQISRYRNPKAPASHKKIDNAFWKKYQAVQKGKEYDVAECLGGTRASVLSERTTYDNKAVKQKKKALQTGSDPKASGRTGLKQERWILNQNSKHFTLQVVALNSEQASRAFILKQRHPERFAYYRLKRSSDTLYAVIYGDFAKRSDAEKVAPHLGVDKPWVRDFGTLQGIIKKQ